MKFLIIGAGSIGERHIRNLLTLGYSDILVYRTRRLPLRTVDASDISILTDWREVLARKPDAAIICSPTALHLEQTLDCLRAGMHVLVEKPLSHTTEGLAELKNLLTESDRLMQVGYMLRFHPLLLRVQKILNEKTYGNLVSFHSHWGEHLPDWHPWEDYRNSYAARTDLGGGAGLTLSHDLDLALWLAASPVARHYSVENRSSRLETDTDEATDLIFRFENGTTGHVHVNFFQKNPERRYEYRTDEATLVVDYFADTLTIYRAKTPPQTERLTDFERNDLFIEQTKNFLSNIELPSERRRAISMEQFATSEQILDILTQ